MFQKPDLHIHTIHSDGSDDTVELLEKIKAAGIDLFSITDHDTYTACEKMRKLLKPGDPTFVEGVELSCEDEYGKYHILGYRYNNKKDNIRQAIQIMRNIRLKKAEKRLRFLIDEKGFSFTDEEIKELMANENPGKPHFAALLLKKGYIKEKRDGFKILSEYHDGESILTPEEIIDAILLSDGIPVLAHGILGAGSSNFSEEQIEARVSRLKGYGLMGLECYYSTYTDEQREIMLKLADKYNLMVSAGSDYHGKNKNIELGQTGNPDPARMERFYQALTTLNDL
ncbi:MAG: PHP domain-containing protein [Clostridia bacterium]|nr:PHP domain-containing protein [Clostridia bacterium]